MVAKCNIYMNNMLNISSKIMRLSYWNCSNHNFKKNIRIFLK